MPVQVRRKPRATGTPVFEWHEKRSCPAVQGGIKRNTNERTYR
jgi:hypothetical protein